MRAMRFGALAATVWLATMQMAAAGDVRPIVGTAAVTNQAPAAQTEIASAPANDSFTDSSGQMLKVADFKGKVVLFSFWASYCAPCKHELGSLDRLQAMLGGADFVVVPVSVDGSESSIASTYANYGVSHLGIFRELSDDFPLSMGVRAIPTNIVIGRDGRVVHFSMGADDWDSTQSVEMIKSFIAENAAPLAATQQANVVVAADVGTAQTPGPSSH
jgi:thiol-disulfide isomerase/thioredoxin